MLRGSWKFFCLTVAAFCLTVKAEAQINLGFSSLPSAQGWTYEANGDSVPETVFSVDGSMLSQNTMGTGFQPAGADNGYHLAGVVDGNSPYTLSLRARVLQTEIGPGFTANDGGFSTAIYTASQFVGLGIGPTSVQVFGLSGPITIASGLDNTTFHDYTVEGEWGTSSSFNVYRDGVLLATEAVQNAAGGDELFLGDTTGSANSQADVSSYSFTQPADVPEPHATGLLFSLVTTGTGVWYYRRRQVFRPR